MFRILSPRHGAVLSGAEGRETAEALEITITGLAEPLDEVRVNGVLAGRDHDRFSAAVRLTQRESEILAETRSPQGTRTHGMRVIWDRGSFKRYGFFIDDNVFFLDDLCQRRPSSLFDSFYLQALRELHRKNGTKFTLNVFYRNDHGDFDLARFPDTYRPEWRENADWLKLAFHAYSEFPDRPYQYAPPQKLAQDYDLVKREIVRFAGEATFCPPTLVHWGMLSPGCFAVLRERGVRVLSGFFVNARTARGDSENRPTVGQPEFRDNDLDIGYFLERDRSAYLMSRGAVHDFERAVTFLKIDICCNLDRKERILEKLEEKYRRPAGRERVCLMTHEQYSFPSYRNHIPDHFERIEAAIRSVTEQGYRPVFLHEGFLGNPRTGTDSA